MSLCVVSVCMSHSDRLPERRNKKKWRREFVNVNFCANNRSQIVVCLKVIHVYESTCRQIWPIFNNLSEVKRASLLEHDFLYIQPQIIINSLYKYVNLSGNCSPHDPLYRIYTAFWEKERKSPQFLGLACSPTLTISPWCRWFYAHDSQTYK